MKRLRTLGLDSPSGPGRGAFISAASGLVAAGQWLYVVADDEVHLGVFPASGCRPGSLMRLLPGQLPRGRKKRKAQKADFEVLVLLPRFTGFPHGALMAMGSGSRRNRRRGVLVPLDRSGSVSGDPKLIDLSGLYGALEEELGALNVEGAVVLGATLCLLNRGHPRRGGSAVVRLSLRSALRSVGRDDGLAALPCKVHRYELGEAGGVSLGFTDGAALPDGRLVFSAVAERADDSYEDGPCLASAVGMIGAGGDLEWVHRLHPPRKVEGITARSVGRAIQLRLVTDADDARVPAGLYATRIPARPVMRKGRPSRRSPSPRR